MRKLERMHPAVGFLYLLGVLGITAFAGSPVVVQERQRSHGARGRRFWRRFPADSGG